MEVGGKKWLCMALVLVLSIFHIEATRILPLTNGEVAFNLKSKDVQERDLSKGIYYGMLPKGVPIPPSGPSKRTSDSPPPPPHHRFLQALFKGPVPPSAPNQDPSKNIYRGMLPKGVPLPPSGPSKRTSDSSPPPPHHRFLQALFKGPVPPSAPNQDPSKNIYHGMLPKGVPLPPSGPSKRTSDSSPPPPHHRFRQALFKGPIPPSAPNTSPFDTSPPPPRF